MFGKARRIALTLAALAGAAAGGAAIAGAATSHSATTTAPSTPQQPPPAAFRNMPAPGTAAHEDAEKAVTVSDATKAQEAAVKAAGGGTAGDVTTDFTGHGYEVTVTKTDGTKVEFHLDSSFTVMALPPSGPRGAGGPGAPGFFHA